jgi:uncharacterized protein YxeA
MKALVVLLVALPLLLITIVSFYSEEIWSGISQYIASEPETHKSQKKSNRNPSLSEQTNLWKVYSSDSILAEAKETWYKLTQGNLSAVDPNGKENPTKFQLFSSNGKMIEGQFIKQGNNWIELPKDADYYFTFREVKRDQKWIHLHDDSRNYSAKLPFKLEFMLLRTGKSFYKYKPALPVWELN